MKYIIISILMPCVQCEPTCAVHRSILHLFLALYTYDCNLIVVLSSLYSLLLNGAHMGASHFSIHALMVSVPALTAALNKVIHTLLIKICMSATNVLFGILFCTVPSAQ